MVPMQCRKSLLLIHQRFCQRLDLSLNFKRLQADCLEIKNGVKTFYAKNRQAWRKWLERNGEKERSVWLIIYKKDAVKKSVNYPDAVEEGLCFGWIDSKANKRDENSFYQSFAKRKPKSNWSKINKGHL